MKVVLRVDGKKVPLNEFVEKFLGGTLEGAVTTLKGVNSRWREMELKIDR